MSAESGQPGSGGLRLTDNTVCDYDEGFFSGVLGEYLHKEFSVKEIDCWSTGDRTCPSP